MYRVLVPIDHDEDRVLAQVRTVADLPDASASVEASLLHVFTDRPHGKPAERSDSVRSGTWDFPVDYGGEAERTPIEQVPTGRTAVDFLRDREVTVNGECVPGDPVEAILRTADGIDADLIVLGGRKRSQLGSVLFGSVSQEVLLHADRPVTITGTAGGPTE
ncbi:MAG: universal stress protein [Haloferacaceae archaeon]